MPPAHHFQKGGFDVSTVVCQYLSHVNSSAYSRKQSGKFSAENRSWTLGSAMFAWAMNPDVGCMSSSSLQCEAICASVICGWSFDSVILRPPGVVLNIAGSRCGRARWEWRSRSYGSISALSTAFQACEVTTRAFRLFVEAIEPGSTSVLLCPRDKHSPADRSSPRASNRVARPIPPLSTGCRDTPV